MVEATRDGFTAAQIRAAEESLLRAGVPLMQRAAAGLAEAIADVLKTAADAGRRPTVLLLVGPGNNGGDALYAGARLALAGNRVLIAQVAARIHSDGLAAALAAGAERLGHAPDPVAAGDVQPMIRDADVIVDGILGTGTGADPRLRGGAAEIVTAVRRELDSGGGPAVIAVDIPSGIDPDTGAVPDGNVLRAGTTVTFGGYKAGLLLAPASEYAGALRLIEIGLEAGLAGLEPAVRVRVEP